MSDDQIIKVGSIWWNTFQRIAVEVTCDANGVVSFNYIGVSACGYTPIDKFLTDYQPIRIKRRKQQAESMRKRNRVDDDSDLEDIVLKRMAIDKQEFILMDWVDLESNK
jgi:hypothetical protein